MNNLYMTNLPEYHKTMFMEGYTPEQILYAARQSILDDTTSSPEEPDFTNVKITMEVIRK